MFPRRVLPALFFVFSACLPGCAPSPLATRATSFSAAATAAASDAKNAYQTVEDIYYQAQVSSLVVNFDKNGFEPSSIQPFLPPKDMQVRTDVLNGLASYAELLAEVSGDQSVTALDTQSQALSTALQKVSTDDLKSWAPPSTDLNIAVTALNVLGRVLISNRRSRDLPGILKQMNQPIQVICNLLQEDIGDPQKSGLRNQLANSYTKLIREQQQYIHLNEASMSAAEKRTEVERLPTLVASKMQADKVLAKTQQELADLAKAHSALAETTSNKGSPAFNVLLSQLVQDGEQIKSVYSSLPTK
jgi:hypothetical protein